MEIYMKSQLEDFHERFFGYEPDVRYTILTRMNLSVHLKKLTNFRYVFKLGSKRFIFNKKK